MLRGRISRLSTGSSDTTRAMQRWTPSGCSASSAWLAVRAGAAPALLVDVGKRLLLDGNAAGLDAWACGEHVPLPIFLDAAMPGLQALRRVLEDGAGPVAQTLLLWLPGRAVVLRCQALPVGDGLVAIVLEADADSDCADASSPGQAETAEKGAKLAHELRTPLGAIAAYAEVMATEHFGPLSDPRYREYARNIHAAARHALGVVEAMMPRATGASGGAARELRFKDLAPEAVVQSCARLIAPAAEHHGVRLEVSEAPHLPRIVADEVSLSQMLMNLLTNAVKFSRAGDRVTLLVSQGNDGDVTFSVRDTGPGLAATQENATAAKGLGIGLALTRELAEANGATFDIESAPGEGTCATIRFPATRVVTAW